MRICVIGTGYVGTVTAVCFAHMRHHVVGLEEDSVKLARLQRGEMPFVEAGCGPLLEAGLESGNLRFTNDVGDAVGASEVIFICVGTPLTPSGEADIEALRTVATSMAPYLGGESKVIVTKSTVPVGSGDWITMLIEDVLGPDAQTRHGFGVVSNPEFLREGSAVEDFLFPDRIVLGSFDQTSLDRVADVFEPVIKQEFPHGRPELAPIPLIRTTLESAEMIKYAANAFLATKISFINEIANICERIGGDIRQVAEGIGLDRRIGDSFLDAGIGWGGSCFRKDIIALKNTAEEYGYLPQLLEATLEVNDFQRNSVIRRLQDELKILKGKRIGLLGLSFKPHTDDLRDAPSLTIIERLAAAGSRVSVIDPVVSDLGGLNDRVRFAETVQDVAEGADALVLVTEWPEYCDLDWEGLAATMRTPVVIDGRNVLDADAARGAGFRYVGIGKP